ncbi:replication associated protein [Dipodfec virus RodF1_112]|uniref:Replication-associated protein n=1 Tax=Dipodfec virus RodF1_112 TaxID=2929274 RepID=A0A976N2X2_9VIRU|nr:replication associated protein [Dipodfec virus RodF1_112]
MEREVNLNFKARSYCFTINNYTEEDIQRLDNIQCKYIVYGKEVAPSTGTRHLQGYIQFRNMRSFNALKNDLGNHVHLERAMGSPQQNIEYCTKDGDWKERGERPKQGKRNDLNDAIELVKQKRRIDEAIEEYPETVAKYHKGLQIIANYYKKPATFHRLNPRRCIWLYGAAGSGKTRRAKEIFDQEHYLPGDVYLFVQGNKEFINGYMGEKGALLDDFRHDQINFAVLLKMLDPWNDCPVNTKGSWEWWIADLVIITCCKSPQEEFRGIQEDLNQLLRRIIIQRTDIPEQTDLNEVDSDNSAISLNLLL